MPKEKVLDAILRKYGVSREEVCYVGDDLPDLGIMKQIGLPVAVANATPMVKKIAGYITEKQGGSGAVREVCDLILEVQGKLEEALNANFSADASKRKGKNA